MCLHEGSQGLLVIRDLCLQRMTAEPSSLYVSTIKKFSVLGTRMYKSRSFKFYITPLGRRKLQ